MLETKCSRRKRQELGKGKGEIPMPINYIGFQNLLYQKFISPGQHDAKKTAHALNVSMTTFYNYCEGNAYFPPDLLGRLYTVTGDPDFLNFILNDTDMLLAPRKIGAPEKSLIEETLDVASATGKVVSKIEESLKDGRLNDIKRRKIVHAIDASEKELEDLRKKVNG
mgnify:CR=1 FL=1